MFDPKQKDVRSIDLKPCEGLNPLQRLGIAISATSALLLSGCRVVPAFSPEAYHDHQKDMHARDELQRMVEQGMAKRIPEILREIPCAKPHLEYFERKQVAVEFDCVHDADTDILSSNIIACCMEGANRIDFNRDRLALLTDALNFRGLTVEQIVEVASLVMAPVFVHEIRHAMTDHELDLALGYHMSIGTLEDETISRFDQAECHVAICASVAAAGYDARIVENFFAHSVTNDELIWRMVREGVDSTLEEVQCLSDEQISVLNMSGEELCVVLAEKMKTLKHRVKISEGLVKSRKDDIFDSPDEQLTQRAVEHVDSILVNATEALRNAHDIVSTPEKLNAIAEYFRNKLKAYQTRWKEQYGEMFRVKS